LAKHFRPLSIKDIRRETKDCISVSFQIPDSWKEEFIYEAGQNITLRAQIGEEEVRRSYSVCSSPHENELRIAIKKVKEGKFSTFAFDTFQPGQTFDVLPPTGNFILNLVPGSKTHYVAFAAGSGITPVISILKNILQREPESQFSLIYGNQSRNSIIFLEELEDLKNEYVEKFQLIHVFSREKMEAPMLEGRIDQLKCDLIFKSLIPFRANQEFLLCGPAPMIFSLRDWLILHSVEERKIHFELFSDPGELMDHEKKNTEEKAIVIQEKSLVTIRLDGVSREFQIPAHGPTILEAAIQAGADLPYACRAGVCATCRAKLVKGKVTMDQNYSLAEEELEQGFILACQAHPASPTLLIDFDIR